MVQIENIGVASRSFLPTVETLADTYKRHNNSNQEKICKGISKHAIRQQIRNFVNTNFIFVKSFYFHGISFANDKFPFIFGGGINRSTTDVRSTGTCEKLPSNIKYESLIMIRKSVGESS